MSERDLQLWAYNAKDCCITFEVFERQQEAIEKLSLTWPKLKEVIAFQHRLGELALKAMLRGVRINQEQKKVLSGELKEEAEKRREWLAQACGHPLNPASNKQMKDFFYGDLKLPVKKNRATGKETLNEEALVGLAVKQPLVAPLIKKILELRSLSVFKSTFVDAKLDHDERMRCSYNVGGTKTYRFSSKKNPFGFGCVPAGAEVLTPTGWIPIETVQSGQLVAAYEPTGLLSWEPAEPFSTTCQAPMRVLKSEQISLEVTPAHRVLASKMGRDTWKDYSAEDISTFRSGFKLPVSGTLVEGNSSFSSIRLFVAALADGSYEGTQVRFKFKKARKSQRLIALCSQYGIELKETFTSTPGYRRFWFRKPADWPEKKRWDLSWALGLSQDSMAAMVDEARYWDSHRRGASYIFFSAEKEQAQVLQTLAHLTGNSATLRREEQNAGSYSTTPMYWVNVKPRRHAAISSKHWSHGRVLDKVYCVTVPSSYFVIRWQDSISITGNCNLQNIPQGGEDDEDLELPNVRTLFIPDEEMELFDTDLDSADLRIVVAESRCAEMQAMLDEGKKIYVEVAKEYYRDPTITKSHPAYRLFKSLLHGSHYLGAAKNLAGKLGLTVIDTERIQKWYFEKFPEIKKWQEEFKKQVASRKWVENAFGYRYYIFDRIDDSAFREAIAWLPQSTIACLINRIWDKIDLELPEVEILLQVHDSLVGQYPRINTQLKEQIIEKARIPVPYETPLYIPVGIKSSEKSWGDCE